MKTSYIFDSYRRKELRSAIKRADPVIFEDVLRFLEDDPRTFGSGYLKEIMWRYIRRYDLSLEALQRLQQAALNYLTRPMSREFKFMCQTMALIATEAFWLHIQTLLDSDLPRVQVNAYCLYAYSEGIYAGEQQRLRLRCLKRDVSRRIDYDFFSVEYILDMVSEPEKWQDGKIIYRRINPAELPIIYYLPRHDQKFAQLDMRFCKPDRLLPKFKEILSTGFMDVFTTTGWLYVIYLMHHTEDARVVPILFEFLKAKIDYKFEGITKHLLESAVLKVMHHHHIPQAIECIEQHRETNEMNREYYKDGSNGWLLSYP
jgi:hypothetical protein